MRLSIACTMVSRLRGLSRSVSDGRVLLLVPCNDVQTFTMHRNIDIAFVSQDGIVLESHRNVKPCRRLHNRRAAITLERFSCSGFWYEPGDCVSLTLPSEGLGYQPGLSDCKSGFDQFDPGFKSVDSFDLEAEERGRRSSDYENMSCVR